MDRATTRPLAPLAIESIADLGGRVEALIRVSEPHYLRTSAFADVSSRTLTRFPDLIRHRCECGSARGIGAELSDTETPHLLEHVALELMVGEGAPRTLSGHTSWDFARDGRGVFRVTLGYTDADSGFCAPDLAERSLHAGVAFVNDLLLHV